MMGDPGKASWRWKRGRGAQRAGLRRRR